jgi:hypothetical protein
MPFLNSPPSPVDASTYLTHIKLSTKEALPFGVLNRRLNLSLSRHFDKTKSPRLTTIPVLNDGYRGDSTEGFKYTANIFHYYVIRQIFDIDIYGPYLL